ncbi:tannase and feruloyl esterase [Thozetella sp. PMI_491]|nr:tannase and feruloyl esterase [Thozetella sp. PMI_491]
MGTPASCAPVTFSDLSLFGAEFLSIEASVTTDYSFDVPDQWRYSQPSISVQNATFCNVTISYTRPGQDNDIYVETWLPFEEQWNGRLQALGGGGWVPGRFILTYAGMIGAVADGYATVTTDAGTGGASIPDPWVLTSPGNLNLYALENFGSVSLNDESVIAKSIINSFYGRNASFSYWNGCSQGGRQGSMLAQRYPDAYDGIIAAAPAVNWVEFYTSTLWPPAYMYLTNQYPMACELTQLTALAVSQCDNLDGMTDGIISDPDACRATFDPFAQVGSSFFCNQTNTTMKISTAAAGVANATWNGPIFSSGEPIWHGFNHGADLSTLAPTVCSANGTCSGGPGDGLSSILEIMRDFVAKDLTFNFSSFTHQNFDAVYRGYKQNVGSLMETNDPDLRPFRDAGRKIITYHGIGIELTTHFQYDNTIPTSGSLDFYNKVTAVIPGVAEFYRYYLVPGLGHCWGGRSGQPTTLFDQLRAWVEDGIAPVEVPINVTLPDSSVQERVLCPYPSRPIFDESCANSDISAACWTCSDST